MNFCQPESLARPAVCHIVPPCPVGPSVTALSVFKALMFCWEWTAIKTAIWDNRYSSRGCLISWNLVVVSSWLILLWWFCVCFLLCDGIRARVNCPHSFHLSAKDLDGDKVHCRFANADQGECMNCTRHSFIELDEVSLNWSNRQTKEHYAIILKC